MAKPVEECSYFMEAAVSVSNDNLEVKQYAADDWHNLPSPFKGVKIKITELENEVYDVVITQEEGRD